MQHAYPAFLDRKLARATLRLRLLLDGVKGHAFFTVDAAGSVTSWNRGAERLFGYEDCEVIGQHFSCLFTPEAIQNEEARKLLERAVHDGRASDQSWQVRKDGTRFFAEGVLTPLGKGGYREFGRQTHDVTERRNEEEGMRQTQKLESLGVLASGIAHDFNNLLSGIMGGVGIAMASLPRDHPSYPSLALAEQATEKAADLTHQLLAYAGQGKFIVTRFNLSVLIRDMVALLQTSIPKSVELTLDLEPELPWIEADPSQIQQVVMNLVINGAESIGPEGGWLRVSTRAAPAEKSDRRPTGLEACMEVADSGSGMTEAHQSPHLRPVLYHQVHGTRTGAGGDVGNRAGA